jgi:hypothetical protein
MQNFMSTYLEVLRGLDDDLLAREVAAELGAHVCVDGLAAHAVASHVATSGLHPRAGAQRHRHATTLLKRREQEPGAVNRSGLREDLFDGRR